MSLLRSPRAALCFVLSFVSARISAPPDLSASVPTTAPPQTTSTIMSVPVPAISSTEQPDDPFPLLWSIFLNPTTASSNEALYLMPFTHGTAAETATPVASAEQGTTAVPSVVIQSTRQKTPETITEVMFVHDTVLEAATPVAPAEQGTTAVPSVVKSGRPEVISNVPFVHDTVSEAAAAQPTGGLDAPKLQAPNIPKSTSIATYPPLAIPPVILPGLASASAVYTTNAQGQRAIALPSITIVQNGPAVTIDGVKVSFGSSELVIGSRTRSFTVPTISSATSNRFVPTGPQLGGSGGASATTTSTGDGVGNAIMSAWTAAAGVGGGNNTIITGDASRRLVPIIWSTVFGMAIIVLI